MPNQAGGSDKEKYQVMTLKSGRNLTIREPNSGCKNPTSTSTTKVDNSSKSSKPLNFSLTNDASSLQYNNIPNKEVKSTSQEEQCDELSN
ncbi:hypothetical protein E6C27_scaffold428G00900 [Cucumis melo var. makuwa]|uniref:Uncharacterized protein n=1 Tax=Cucumis melo var. makuwa TaxID=1194695 RepID=A0A5A7UDZ7_CUCMM|nr:hypothetical protein E6C27_scaffold428G00900 [Cucumis melo var. makuwa]